MSKIIVLCCDGTGNTDTGVPSNVKRLHDLLLFDPKHQIPTYHRGVGTDRRRPGENWFRYHHAHLAQLCFGEGVSEALLALYSTLVAQYEHGDRIFLFGFSRGAFTVRALAGLLHVCGLLRREHAGRAPDAVRLYEDAEARIIADRQRRGCHPKFPRTETDHTRDDQASAHFRFTYSQTAGIDFLGLWDTVKAYGWLTPRSFPALRHNASVKTVRHAPALDERRALFQMTGWADGHPDTQEVWFAGDHSDVGGGHDDGNSALTDASLRWMLGEATQAGLLLHDCQKTRDEVRDIEAGAAQTSSATPRSLWIRRGFIALDCLPRRELNNADYPPDRRWRVLWPFGARRPGDHVFGTTVYVHQSVRRQLRGSFGVVRVDDRGIAWPSRS
jgi:uncharacterized protein (DUF2235 family)